MPNEPILVADLVLYASRPGEKPETYRVTAHLKRVDEEPLVKPDPYAPWPFHFTYEMRLKFWRQGRAERRVRGLPANRRYRLRCCRPEEATHVSLVNVCGAIAPIAECERVGTVGWSPEMIERTRQEAVSDFWLTNNFLRDWHWE